MKICLIGSSRSLQLYQEFNRQLSLAGHIVYSISTVSTSQGGHTLTEDEKTILDLVHLRKIQESEAVLIVSDETNYIGESTTRELRWAQILNKLIFNREDLEGLIKEGAPVSDSPKSHLPFPNEVKEILP